MVYEQKWARVVVRWCMARKPSYYCCDRSLTAELRRLTRAGPHIPCHLQSFPISLLSFFPPILCCIFPPPPFPSFSLMPNNTSPDPTTAIYNLYHFLFSLSLLYCIFYILAGPFLNRNDHHIVSTVQALTSSGLANGRIVLPKILQLQKPGLQSVSLTSDMDQLPPLWLYADTFPTPSFIRWLSK